MVGKEKGKKGLVLVTLHKKHFRYASAKEDSLVYIVENNDTVYCKEAHPAMLGDTTNTQWGHFLEHNLDPIVPVENGAPPGLYKVYLMFQVNKDGTISDVEVVEDPGYGTGTEAKRIMSRSPLWTPAMCGDKPVLFRQKQTISFTVSE